MRSHPILPPALALLVAACLATPARAADNAGLEFFERKVRPILVGHCANCHGPGKQKAGLRLDSRAAVLKGGDSGPALVPGEPDKSRLIAAIRYTGDLRMPQKGKLPDEAIADLTAWVKMGAPWPDSGNSAVSGPKDFDLRERMRFWSFQPVRRVVPPAVKNSGWVRNDIDRFILARLEEKGLAPAKSADRRTLIRRVYFDLIGLPPTPEEVDAFLKDESADAYEKVVDRLLQSPRYGERWGRHWLDLVRYAETCGHEFDFDMHEAWRYRDYVIRAFNDDLPYDRFVTEHVAGDLLPTPRRHPKEGWNESILATGFWFLGESKHSPVDVRQDQAERLDNQIDVFSKAFLGLTVSCARCHDHKFDPITTKDYYALFGHLQSSRFQRAFIDDPAPLRAAVAEFTGTRGKLQALAVERSAARLDSALGKPEALAALRKADPALAELLALADPAAPADRFAARRYELLKRWQARAEQERSWWEKAVRFEDFGGANYGKWFVTGEAFGAGPSKGEAVLSGNDAKPVTGVRLPGVADSGAISPRLTGVLRSPTFRLDRDFILYRAAGRQTQINLIIDGFQQIRAPIYGGLTIHLGHGDDLRWLVQDVRMWKGHHAYIEFLDEGPGSIAVDCVAFADQPSPPPPTVNRELLRLLEDRAVASPDALRTKLTETLRGLVRRWREGRLDGEAAELLNALLRNDELARLGESVPPRQEEGALRRQVAELEGRLSGPRRAMAMADGTGQDERVFIRGNHKNLGEVVPRRFLEALAGPDQPAPGRGSGRLGLARKVTDPANPLTARVMVNRVWQHHFGEGIVRSPDNFGKLGELPTHPELLDWLATEFVRQGWSVKKMHKLMLLTSAYRMASSADPAADEADPQNKLLHKMPVRRLEAEAIRDALLAASGRLDRTMGGPGVPPHLTPFMVGRGRPGGSGPLDGAGRRSVYLQVRRNFLDPMFLAFDYPVPFSTIGRRSVSNVPAQALAMLNNPFVVQQSGLWAQRVLAEPNRTPKERVAAMYRTAFAREPNAEELADALAFLDAQAKEYGRADDPRAWADLAHVLVNVKEFIFVK